MARKKPLEPAAPNQENECIEFSSRTSLHVSEEGVGATFVNRRRKELRKIKYDGCYCKAVREGRADYIVGFDQATDIILELKGSDLKHALVQVADSLDQWRNDLIHYPQIVCLIVLGHTIPRMRSNIGVMEREFLDRHRTLLWIRQSGAERFSFNKLAGKRS
jgi:hypothetical protein